MLDIYKELIMAKAEIKLLKRQLERAKPETHGHWKGKPIAGLGTVRCSECNSCFIENNGRWRYCPYCGAKMDGKERP